MKAILTTTTALSVALSTFQPLPLLAQEAPGCVAGVGAGCGADPGAAAAEAAQRAAEEAQRAAEEAAAAAQRAAEEQAAQAAAEAEARQQAEAEAQAQAREEAARRAAAEAQARAQAEAQLEAERREAEQKAQAEAADAAARAKLQAAEDAAKSAADAAEQVGQAAEDAAPDLPPPVEPGLIPGSGSNSAGTAEAPAAPEPVPPQGAEAEAAAPDAAQPEVPPAEAQPAESAPADGTSDTAETVPVIPPAAEPAPAAPATTEEQAPDAAPQPPAQTATDEPAPQAPDADQPAPPPGQQAEAEPAAPPPPSEAQIETLTSILEQPDGVDPAAVAAAAGLVGATGATAAGGGNGPAPLDAPPPEGAVVTTQTVTEADTRSSAEDFTRAGPGDPGQPAPGQPAGQPAQAENGRKKRSGLSDFEKVGLVALGALAVGAILSDGKQVVDNTGDRVVVKGDDGRYYVYKDDDAVLRQPGSNVRTEQYRDGSTRTIVARPDGSQVVTIRDAAGRVLRRSAYDRDGRETLLIDDLTREEPVIVSQLPRPRADRLTISTADEGAALRARMAAIAAADEVGRRFSLRQIREVPQVRALAATIDVTNVTFDSGSAAIRPVEAENLAGLGRFIKAMLRENPGEVFLVEGHTDAVGSAASNLALSDRRAESVALALTEYFDVPPENLVVQGYGESELKIDTEAAERANRRVVVRVITPLLQRGAN